MKVQGKCADAVGRKSSKLVHACRRYSLPKLVRFLRHSIEQCATGQSDCINVSSRTATQSRECLRQAFKSIFGLVWYWPLTFWPPKLLVAYSCSVDHLCRFASTSVRSFSKYRVRKCNRRTDGQTENWEHNASACQTGIHRRRSRAGPQVRTLTIIWLWTCEGPLWLGPSQ